MASITKKPSHREAKKEECRKGIARAAVRLFEEKGFEATTMDEIALEAGVSRPTVFNYFPHKEDILSVLGLMMGERIAVSSQAISQESAADPVAAIRRILMTMAAAFAEFPETSRAFHFFKMQDVHRRAATKSAMELDSPMQAQRRLLLDLIERGQAQGVIRKDFTSVELIRHFMIGLFASTVGPWFGCDRTGEPLESIVERHFNLYVEGIAP